MQLNPRVKKRLLQWAEQGITPDIVEDFEDLVAINAAADDIQSVRSNLDGESLMEDIVRVGNVRLAPMSLGAGIWMEERVEKLFPNKGSWNDQHWYGLCTIFAMSKGRSPGLLIKLTTKREIKSAVKDFSRRCGATYVQLIDACNDIIKRHAPKGSSSGKDDGSFGPLLELLISEYGQTVDYWLWEAKTDVITGLCTEYANKRREEAAAHASAGVAGSVATLPNRYDPIIRQVDVMRRMMIALRRKIEKRQKDNGQRT